MKREQTHCLRGHSLLDTENVRKTTSGGRGCIECEKIRYERKKRGVCTKLTKEVDV